MINVSEMAVPGLMLLALMLLIAAKPAMNGKTLVTYNLLDKNHYS